MGRSVNYIGFARIGNQFGPAQGNGEYCKTLPAGHYKLEYDHYNDILLLNRFEPKLDDILNIGSKEFNEVLNNAKKFLSPETEDIFKQNGYLMKRSYFLYGPPGTGKSVLCTKVCNIAVEKKNAISVYPDGHQALERFVEVINDTDPNRFLAITLEEFDSSLRQEGDHNWTTLLDGQFQAGNRILVASTNNIGAIPSRLLRPGRFSRLYEIPALTEETKREYLVQKSVPTETIERIMKYSESLTIDEMKEIVQNVVILGEDLDSTVKAITAAKKLGYDAD
jgi:SpoVK/Ycf46/Vps4 family AAA+-type ATPase